MVTRRNIQDCPTARRRHPAVGERRRLPCGTAKAEADEESGAIQYANRTAYGVLAHASNMSGPATQSISHGRRRSPPAPPGSRRLKPAVTWSKLTGTPPDPIAEPAEVR